MRGNKDLGFRRRILSASTIWAVALLGLSSCGNAEPTVDVAAGPVSANYISEGAVIAASSSADLSLQAILKRDELATLDEEIKRLEAEVAARVEVERRAHDLVEEIASQLELAEQQGDDGLIETLRTLLDDARQAAEDADAAAEQAESDLQKQLDERAKKDAELEDILHELDEKRADEPEDHNGTEDDCANDGDTASTSTDEDCLAEGDPPDNNIDGVAFLLFGDSAGLDGVRGQISGTASIEAGWIAEQFDGSFTAPDGWGGVYFYVPKKHSEALLASLQEQNVRVEYTDTIHGFDESIKLDDILVADPGGVAPSIDGSDLTPEVRAAIRAIPPEDKLKLGPGVLALLHADDFNGVDNQVLEHASVTAVQAIRPEVLGELYIVPETELMSVLTVDQLSALERTAPVEMLPALTSAAAAAEAGPTTSTPTTTGSMPTTADTPVSAAGDDSVSDLVSEPTATTQSTTVSPTAEPSTAPPTTTTQAATDGAESGGGEGGDGSNIGG